MHTLALPLAACAPLPESGGRATSTEAIWPGIGAIQELMAVTIIAMNRLDHERDLGNYQPSGRVP